MGTASLARDDAPAVVAARGVKLVRKLVGRHRVFVGRAGDVSPVLLDGTYQLLEMITKKRNFSRATHRLRLASGTSFLRAVAAKQVPLHGKVAAEEHGALPAVHALPSRELLLGRQEGDAGFGR